MITDADLFRAQKRMGVRRIVIDHEMGWSWHIVGDAIFVGTRAFMRDLAGGMWPVDGKPTVAFLPVEVAP